MRQLGSALIRHSWKKIEAEHFQIYLEDRKKKSNLNCEPFEMDLSGIGQYLEIYILPESLFQFVWLVTFIKRSLGCYIDPIHDMTLNLQHFLSESKGIILCTLRLLCSWFLFFTDKLCWAEY